MASDWREQKITGKRTKIAHFANGGVVGGMAGASLVGQIANALRPQGMPNVSAGEAQAGVDVTYAPPPVAPAAPAAAPVPGSNKTLTYEQVQELTRQHNAQLAAAQNAAAQPVKTRQQIAQERYGGTPAAQGPTAGQQAAANAMDVLMRSHSADASDNYAEGGRVKGPGSATSDSVPARLSDGEYVLPADTVKAVGKHKLDALRAATHKPVGMMPMKMADGGSVDDSTAARVGNTIGGTIRTTGDLLAGAPGALAGAVGSWAPRIGNAVAGTVGDAARAGARVGDAIRSGVGSFDQGMNLGLQNIGITGPEPTAPAASTPPPTVVPPPATPVAAPKAAPAAEPSYRAVDVGWSRPRMSAPVADAPAQAETPAFATPTATPQIDANKAYTDARNMLDTGGIAGFAGARSILGAAQKTSGMINAANEAELQRAHVTNEAPLAMAHNKTEADINAANNATRMAETGAQTEAHLKGIGMQTQAELERQKLVNEGQIAHAQASQPRMTAVQLDPTRQGVVINDPKGGVHVVDPAQQLAQQSLEAQIQAAPPEKQAALRQLAGQHGMLGDAEFQKRVRALLGS